MTISPRRLAVGIAAALTAAVAVVLASPESAPVASAAFNLADSACMN